MLEKSQYCEGKVIYDKKSAISARNARYREDHVELRVYHHELCNGWHLTSQNPHFGEVKYNKKSRRKFGKSSNGRTLRFGRRY